MFLLLINNINYAYNKNHSDLPFTQGHQFKGKITDVNGVPLPGASILVKNTNIGTTSDFDGNYELTTTEKKPILIFSYVGYLTKEITANNNFTINVQLEEDVSQLDEVVVVGYGTQKKENLTGAVSTVTSEVIENRAETSLASSLQGTSPGLNITKTTGQPGSENISIQVRGVTSANGNVDPLLLVDGVASPLFTLQTINPLDVKSITVLKDAAAAAIYGARAAGGVILLTNVSSM